ncbi:MULTISPECIES: hypothetical protein [unclassified Virgibacillus]|uniref:hypothetical protein n=1 Tax=unclassified Virgibacillus TaxID=2620237 RepID=UPI0012EB479D|nr:MULTISPECIES: hypothetical protein [unclassified Virgibacillus]MBS7428388.1 hypothetical protein [Virgibacillus sp. 19R1-5]
MALSSGIQFYNGLSRKLDAVRLPLHELDHLYRNKYMGDNSSKMTYILRGF